ncbi:MAG: hypothetical protein R2855_20120 [Thermomicrobiales bacterium]
MRPMTALSWDSGTERSPSKGCSSTPESILTPVGATPLANFLSSTQETTVRRAAPVLVGY